MIRPAATAPTRAEAGRGELLVQIGKLFEKGCGSAPARLGRVAGLGAAVLGPAMTSYTGVLLADTALPAWHDAHRELPVLFAAAAGGLGLAGTRVLAGRHRRAGGGRTDGASARHDRRPPGRSPPPGWRAPWLALLAGSLATRFGVFEAGKPPPPTPAT